VLAWDRHAGIVMNGSARQSNGGFTLYRNIHGNCFRLNCVSLRLPKLFFSLEYRIICKNARFVFLFETNTANLSASLLSYKLGEYKSELSSMITFQAELKHCNMKPGSLHKIQRAPKHLSDTGAHPPCIGCQNTVFIQLIPFIQGVLQIPYQFSF